MGDLVESVDGVSANVKELSEGVDRLTRDREARDGSRGT
jgi:hypothetical protein